MKAWNYAQTIFGSEQLQIAYPKAELGRKHNIFLFFEDHVCLCKMRVFGLRIIWMYYIYRVSYLSHIYPRNQDSGTWPGRLLQNGFPHGGTGSFASSLEPTSIPRLYFLRFGSNWLPFGLRFGINFHPFLLHLPYFLLARFHIFRLFQQIMTHLQFSINLS